MIELTYPEIVGSFAQGHPGFANAQLTPAEGDRRIVDFSTHPIGSFANGFPLPLTRSWLLPEDDDDGS